MTNEADRLREILRILERKLGLLDDSVKSCCGVTLSQCHTLVEIGLAVSLSLNDLAGLLDLDKSTTSRAVDQLVRRGFASRQADPASRRHILIGLSPAGQVLFDGIETEMQHYYHQIMENIPAAQRLQVIDSLQLLAAAVTKVG
jgi:DNA-binding MarR family transcriptional regulator